MFNILSCQENANQNYTKIASYPVRKAIIKKRANATENVQENHCG